MSFSNSRTNKDRRDAAFQRTVDLVHSGATNDGLRPNLRPVESEPITETVVCGNCYGAGEYSRDTDGGGDAVTCSACDGRGYTTAVRS